MKQDQKQERTPKKREFEKLLHSKSPPREIPSPHDQ